MVQKENISISRWLLTPANISSGSVGTVFVGIADPDAVDVTVTKVVVPENSSDVAEGGGATEDSEMVLELASGAWLSCCPKLCLLYAVSETGESLLGG